MRNQNSNVILLNVENLSPKLFDLKQTARGNQSFINFIKQGRSVRLNAGDFFVPSPAANLVGYGEDGHEKDLPIPGAIFKCANAPFIFQQIKRHSVSSQRKKFRFQ